MRFATRLAALAGTAALATAFIVAAPQPAKAWVSVG